MNSKLSYNKSWGAQSSKGNSMMLAPAAASPPPGRKAHKSKKSPRAKAHQSKTSPHKSTKSPKKTEIDSYIEDVLSKEHSILLMEGRLSKVGRTLNYSIREFPGAYFSINIIVLETLQKWTVYVPITEDMMELLRMWDKSPAYKNKTLLGGWLLSCTNLEFSDEAIIAANFDHTKLRERCISEMVRFVNSHAVKMQAAARGFVTRSRIGSRPREQSPDNTIRNGYYVASEVPLHFGSALEENSYMSQSSLTNYKQNSSRMKDSVKKTTFKPSETYSFNMTEIQDVYSRPHDANTDTDMSKRKSPKKGGKGGWDNSTLIGRSGYRSDGASLSDDSSLSKRNRKGRKKKSNQGTKQGQGGYIQQYPSYYYSEDEIEEGSTYNMESNSMLHELLDVRSEISEALTMFRSEMDALRNGIVQQLQIQGSPTSQQQHESSFSPVRQSMPAPQPAVASVPDEITQLREEMRNMLMEMKSLHQQLNEQRNQEVAALHHQNPSIQKESPGPATITPPIYIPTPEHSAPVRIGSYSTRITEVRPLTGIEKPGDSAALNIETTEPDQDFSFLEGVGSMSTYQRPQILLQMNSTDFDANHKPHSEILNDIRIAAMNPELDTRLREQESAELEREPLQDVVPTRLTFLKEGEKYDTSSAHVEELTKKVEFAHSPTELREAVVAALVANNEQLAENVAQRLLFIACKTVDTGSLTFHFMIDTVLPRFDTVVASIQQFSGNIKIVKAYVEILALIVASAGTDFVMEECGSTGVCNCLMDVMDRFDQDDDLAAQILLLGCRLTTTSVKNRHRMGSMHNSRVIADLLARYRRNRPMLLKLTRFICNICTEAPSILDNMGDVGVCERLLECIYENSDEPKLFTLLSRCVLQLCYNNHEKNQRRFASSQGFEIFFSCMKRGLRGSDVTFKHMVSMVLGVCGTDESTLDMLPLGPLIKLTKEVFAVGSDVSIEIVKAVLTLIYNFAPNASVRRALVEAGVPELLSCLQLQTSGSDFPRMVGMTLRRLSGLSTADAVMGPIITSNPNRAVTPRANFSRGKSRGSSRQDGNRVPSPMGDYKRPHLLKSQKSVDLDANHMRSAEILRNIERAAADPTIEKILRERESKAVAELKAIDASEKLRRSVKEAEDRKKINGSASRLVQMEALVEKTDDPAELKATLLSAVSTTSESLVEKTLQKILLLMGNATGTRAMKTLVQLFSSFDSFVTAMLLYPQNFVVAKCVVEIVTLMLISVENDDLMVEEAGRAGLCELLFDCMVLGVNDDDLAMQCILLGCRLTANCQRNRHRMSTLRNCDILGELYLTFMHVKPVLTKLCRLCGNMCFNSPTILDTMGEGGVCEKVLECMESNRFDRYCVGILAKVILMLCSNNHQNMNRFSSPRGFEVILNCLSSSRTSDPETFQQMCMLLMGTFGSSAAALDLLPSAHAAKIIKSIIDDDQLDDMSLKMIVSVTFNFATNSSLRSAMNQIGMKESLENLQTKRTDSELVSSMIMTTRRLDGLSTAGVMPINPSSSQKTERKGSSRMKRSESGNMSRSSRMSSRGGQDDDGTANSTDLLRSMERAVADPTIDQRLREKETKDIEARNAADATERARRSVVRQKKVVKISDTTTSNNDDPNALREMLLTTLLSGTESEVNQVIGRIAKLLNATPGNRALLTIAEVVFPTFEYLIEAFRKYSKNKDVINNCMSCISAILKATDNTSDWVEEAGTSGLCDLMLDACKISDDICQQSLTICYQLVQNSPENRLRIGTRHNCDIVGDLFLSCISNAVSLGLLVRFVYALCSESPTVLDNLGLGGACEKLLECMDANSKNGELLAELSRMVLVFCFHNNSINRERFATQRGADICMKCLRDAASPGSGHVFKQVFMTIMGVFATAPDRIDLIPHKQMAALAGDIVFEKIPCEDVHLKSILTMIFNFGANETIRNAFIAEGLVDPLMDLQTQSQKRGIPRLAIMAYRRLCSLETRGSQSGGRVSTTDRLRAASAERRHRGGSGGRAPSAGEKSRTRAPRTESEKNQPPAATVETEKSQPRPSHVESEKSRTTAPKAESEKNQPPAQPRPSHVESEKSRTRAPKAESERNQPPAANAEFENTMDANHFNSSSPAPASARKTKAAILTESNLAQNKAMPQSPRPPSEPQSTSSAEKPRVPRKVIDRSYTAISESDPLFQDLPAEQSEVSELQTVQLRKSEAILEEQVAHEVSRDEAIRRLQKAAKSFIAQKSKANQAKQAAFRLAGLIGMIDKTEDIGIIMSCITVAAEMNSDELAMKTIKRCNKVVKLAKEQKVNSLLAVKLIEKAKLLMFLLKTFIDNSAIIMLGIELITRVSYAGGASDAIGKAGFFHVFYAALNKYPDNVVLIGALLVCGVRLTSKKSTNKKRAGTREGFQAIVNVFRANMDNATVVDRLTRYTCNCIENLPACQDYFREAGGCEVIVNIYTFGPEHIESIEIISRLIMNLTALNNVENMKALGTKVAISKYFDGLAISSLNPKVFKSVAMMICNVFNRSELFLDILPTCDLPKLLIGVFEDGGTGTDMDRQEVIFAGLMVAQFFASMETLKPQFMSSRFPNVLMQFTAKEYSKRIRKAASGIVKRLRGESGSDSQSDAGSRQSA